MTSRVKWQASRSIGIYSDELCWIDEHEPIASQFNNSSFALSDLNKPVPLDYSSYVSACWNVFQRGKIAETQVFAEVILDCKFAF